MAFTIDKVLKKRHFVRVVFISGERKETIDFADKFGQYRQLKRDKKKREEYSKEWVESYLNPNRQEELLE